MSKQRSKGRFKSTEKREVLLAQKPRIVPLTAILLLAFGGGQCMIGYSILSLSSAAVWLWPMHSEIVTPLVFLGPLGQTTGKVVNVDRSGVFGSRGDQPSKTPGRLLQFAFMVSPMNAEVELDRVTFEFFVDGATYTSRSFTPSTASNLPGVGATVTIEYVLARPVRARIVGMSYHAYGWQVAWTLFFPLIGVALIFPRLLATQAQVRLCPSHSSVLLCRFYIRLLRPLCFRLALSCTLRFLPNPQSLPG